MNNNKNKDFENRRQGNMGSESDTIGEQEKNRQSIDSNQDITDKNVGNQRSA